MPHVVFFPIHDALATGRTASVRENTPWHAACFPQPPPDAIERPAKGMGLR
jgi:hypothetical protein